MKFLRVAFVLSFATMCGLAACVGDDPTTSGDDTTGNDASADGSGDGTVGPGADGSTGTDSGDAGTKRYCQTITAPSGVADFFCADFDGTDLTEGFQDGSVTVTDGSSLALTQDVSLSAPNALVSNTTGTDQDEAYLLWRKGGNNLETITASVEINPDITGGQTFGGTLQLLTIQEAFGTPTARLITFEYATGEDFLDASNEIGYVLVVQRTSFQPDYWFLPNLPAGWTDVEISYDLNAGSVSLSYNGVLQVAQTVASFGAVDSVARVSIGTANIGSKNAYPWRFDNFRVSTTRNDGG